MEKNNIMIRLEKKEEHQKVENLVRESFWNVYRPGCLEHYVLHQLRNDPAFVSELDFVMFLNENDKEGKLIGQNMFMRTSIKADDGRNIPIMTMGPICITPELKRQGYGKVLLDYSLDKAAKLGCGAVCFEGNIDFYGKSGFRPASEFNIRYHGLEEGEDASFFLCKELIPGYLNGITGEYATPAGYFADEKETEEFDKMFPYKEKKKLPGQLFWRCGLRISASHAENRRLKTKMKSMKKDWYKKVWTMDIQNVSWVEDTKKEVDFLIDQLKLQGNEKILDLACGYGRHSLELARRGYDVTGIDITSEYIEYATEQAEKEGLKAKFLCMDIREVNMKEKFDVVINMADGAIGYLENDMENMKIFEVVSNALKKGGKHFMDIMNGSYAEMHFPCKLWDEGEKCLTLSAFEWDKKSKILLYGQVDYPYGEPLWKPEIKEGNPIRLYTISEISMIFSALGMSVCKSYADYTGKPSSDNDIQLMVYSVRS